MHPSAYRAMARSIETFVPQDRHITVVDIGSATTEDRIAEGLTHGALFSHLDAEVVGVDIIDGPNVDRVLKKMYRFPMGTNSTDVVVSGQVFEHIPFFWATMLEVARILRPGGVFLMTVPSRGHKHMAVDCWRIYDDGVRAMAAFSGLKLRRAVTDYIPPRAGAGGGGRTHWDYPSDRKDDHYWGDTVGVFEKPKDYPTHRLAALRAPIRWWANQRAEDFAALIEEKQARQRRQAAAAERAAQREAAARAGE